MASILDKKKCNISFSEQKRLEFIGEKNRTDLQVEQNSPLIKKLLHWKLQKYRKEKKIQTVIEKRFIKNDFKNDKKIHANCRHQKM